MRSETLARPSMAARPSFTRQISIGSSIDLKGGGTMPKALGNPNILSLPMHRISTPVSPDRIFTGKIGQMTTIWQRPKTVEPSHKSTIHPVKARSPLENLYRKTKPLSISQNTSRRLMGDSGLREIKPKSKVEKISLEMLKAFLAKQAQKPSFETHSQNGQTKTALEVQTAETKLAKPFSAPALFKTIEPKARQAIRIMQVRKALAEEVAVTKPGEQTRATTEQAVKTQRQESSKQEISFEVDQSAKAERKTIIYAAVSETEHEAKIHNPEQVKELSGTSLAFKIMQRKTIKAMSEVAKNTDGSFIKLAISAVGKRFHSAKEAKAEKDSVLEKTPPAKVTKSGVGKRLSREYVFREILQGHTFNPFKTLIEK